MNLSIYTDGGSRGNPGRSGCGLVVYDDLDNILFQQSLYLGIKTNNQAEYSGLVSALNWLSSNQQNYSIDKASIFMDSQLIIRQMQGIYKVKSKNLIAHFQKAKDIVSQLSFPISFKHVLRDKNTLADELANSAMDQGHD
jgi:ribonuclease HI